MRHLLRSVILFSTLFFLSNITYSQFWTEDFGTGCNAGQLATIYSGVNGSWSITNTGANGANANTWYISAEERSAGAGSCSTGCGGTNSNSLFVSYDVAFYPGFGTGSIYLDGFGTTGTDKRVESPTIDCTGESNISLSFLYFENGELSDDNCEVWYFDGTVWALLNDPGKTPTGSCGGQGEWTSYLFTLPASADGNANVKIGYRWTNDDDGLATDPAFAVDDITLTSVALPSDPEVQFVSVTSAETEDNLGITNQLQITNPDPGNATTVTVNITTGDMTRLLFWTNPQVFVFPAGSSTNIDVDLYFDDEICQEIDVYTLSITSVVTPTKAPTIGANNPHLFTLTDDEMQYRESVNEGFEAPFFTGLWTPLDPTNVDWLPSIAAISGSFSYDYTATVASRSYGQSATSRIYSADCLNGVQTVWRMNIEYPVTPDANNDLAIGLTGAGLPGLEDGYGLFLVENPAVLGTHLIGIVRQDAGTPHPVPVFISGLLWNPATVVGIEVTRDEVGNWGLSLDNTSSGAFTNLLALADLGGLFPGGTLGGLDATHIHMGLMAFAVRHNTLLNGKLKVDDISVNIKGCKDTYYSQGTGFFNANIWDIAPIGTPNTAMANQFSRFEIQAGHVVTQNENTCIETLLTSPGGVYTFTPSALSLGIHGDFLNLGTFVPLLSNVAFGGHVLQNITGNATIDFAALTLANDNLGVLLGQHINIHGLLLPILGDLDLANYDLTLKSSALGTGGIFTYFENPFIPGTHLSNIQLTGTGLIVQERHIIADAATDAYPGGWVGIGTPITNQTISEWNDNFITTGFPGSDFPSYADGGGTLFNNIIKFDEPTGLWVGATGLGESIDNERGYFVYFGAAAQDIIMYDDITVGDVTIASPDLTNTTSGYNLMTNPYPCEIDWRIVHANSTDIGPIISVFDSEAHAYVTYNAVSATPVIIPNSQSFWIQVTGASPSLEFTESCKTVAGVGYLFERDDVELQELTLSLSNGQITDESYFGFSNEATNNYDSNLDGMKMNIPLPGTVQILISTLSEDNVDLGYNYYNTLTEGTEIPVKIKVTTEDSYTFEISNLISFPENTCIFIHDLITDEMIEVTDNFSYTFESEVFDGVRFNIVLGAPIQINSTQISCNGLSDGSITVESIYEGETTFVWYNENEELILEESNSNGTSSIENLPIGNYTVEVSNDNSLCSSMMQVIELDDPIEEQLTSNSLPDLCSSEDLGKIILNGEGINADYTYEITQNEELIEFGIVEGYFTRDLPSGIYQVEVVSNCTTFQNEFDLRDLTAPQVEIVTASNVLPLIDGVAILSMTAITENTNIIGWMLNGELISNEIDVELTLTEAGTYTIQLIALGNGFTCSAEDERVITVSNLVSVEELTDSNISIYTTSEELVVDLNGESNTNTIQIINTLGQVVFNSSIKTNTNTLNYNITSLSRGAYIVNILSDTDVIYSGKFIK